MCPAIFDRSRPTQCWHRTGLLSRRTKVLYWSVTLITIRVVAGCGIIVAIQISACTPMMMRSGPQLIHASVRVTTLSDNVARIPGATLDFTHGQLYPPVRPPVYDHGMGRHPCCAVPFFEREPFL